MMLRFVLSLLAITATLFAQGNPDWHRAVPGFKLAGNLYYVGTADLAVYLVHTPQGNILINSDFKQDVPAIRASIEKLGFKYGDTKIILISHAHGDHDEGVGVIKQETGAKLMVMDADVPDVESTSRGRPGAHVDRTLHDGDTVELGGSKLTARLTPGHTKGCTTWTMQVQDGGRKLNAVIIGSPNVNPGYILVGNTKYPQIAEDYVKTFAVLKSLPCDLFLGAHGAYFGMLAKYDKVKAEGPNPFIDPQGYRAYVDEREATFQKEWARQKNAPPSASGTVPDSLRRSLSFHASFDKGMDADVARGDRAIYHATDYKPQSAAQPGQGDVDVAIEKGTGIAGSDALRFRSKNTRALFFRGDRHVGLAGGTVSFWLRLDPEKDLAPGFCDPIQVTDKAYNDSALWVDFTKDDVPRHFRMGVFGSLKAWNPGNTAPDQNPDFLRRLVVVDRPGFSRDRWTHVALTWTGLDKGADGSASLFLNGKRISSATGIRESFEWDSSRLAIRLGVNYTGLMDDVAAFDRPLGESDIASLYAAGTRQ